MKMNTMEKAARQLCESVEKLTFAAPVSCVYNPLVYAWKPHSEYLKRYADGPRKVVFMGMNPGPFGMAQTGVPFGEIDAVRGWMGIDAEVSKPNPEHPKRPVEGFECGRSEVSGRRLWGLFADRFVKATHFFREHFVANYCPLVFMGETGRNITPDKLPAQEREELFKACDEHLRAVVEALQPEWVIGVGAFAEGRIREALHGLEVRIGRILHPSPASPAANRDWAGTVTKELVALGVWQK